MGKWVKTRPEGVMQAVMPADLTLEWMREYHREWEREIVSGPRFYVVLLDTRTVRTLPNPATRAEMAQNKARTSELGKGRCVAAALIVKSAIVRGAITAISWIQPDEIPTTCFAEPEAAKAFLSAAWRKAGHRGVLFPAQ